MANPPRRPGQPSRADALRAAIRPDTVPTQLPPPITGWNTRDALTSMEPTDAITLNNLYPDYGGCVSRNGYTSFISAIAGSPVKTLAEFWAGSTHKFLAACGGQIWNITGGTKTSLGSGFSSDAWQTVMFSTKMFFTNGADAAQIFDGTTLTAATLTSGPANPLWGCQVYQSFMIFWAQNDTAFYYLAVGAISGTLHKFDLSTITEKGGNLVAVTTYSHDGGNGVLDFVAFILTSGEVIVYYGTDPSQASLWQLVARYQLAAPVNIRSVCRYGAESYMTTNDDHVPLQQQLVALKVGQAPPRSKVSGAVATAVADNASAFGWQALYYTKGRRLIFNIPNSNGQFTQHVYNTATDAWCQFTGMQAYCWSLFNNNLYFGDAAGNVWQADNGFLDAGTAAISYDGQQAWNVFSEDTRKRVSAVRPLIQLVGNSTFNFGVGFDYAPILVGPPTATPQFGAIWNVALWNVTPWSPETFVTTIWGSQQGTGTAIGFRLTGNTYQPQTWLRTDIRIEPGQGI